MGKFYPARDKFRVRVWGAQAVGVVYLSRFIWIPKRSNTSINLSIIDASASLSSPKKVFFQASTKLEKSVHLHTDSKLLKQRDTHFGRYRVTVIILSFKVTLWKVRPMLSQYWSSSSGLFLDTRPSCEKQNPFSLLQYSELYQQTVPTERDSRSGLVNSAQAKIHLSGHIFREQCTRNLLLLQLRFADNISKEEHLGFIHHPVRTSLGRNTIEQPT